MTTLNNKEIDHEQKNVFDRICGYPMYFNFFQQKQLNRKFNS